MKIIKIKVPKSVINITLVVVIYFSSHNKATIYFFFFFFFNWHFLFYFPAIYRTKLTKNLNSNIQKQGRTKF